MPSTRASSPLPHQQIGHQVQRRAGLVVAVLGALHDVRVHPEGHRVDEHPVRHLAQIDRQFLAVGQGVETAARVGPVEAEIHGEVVAGPGADHQERQTVLGGDHRDLCLGAVAARHAEQIRALGDRLPGQRGHVEPDGGVEQDHPRAELLRPLDQPEAPHLSAARPGVHDEHGPPRPGRGHRPHGLPGVGPAQRGAGTQHSRAPAHAEDQRVLPQAALRVEHEHADGRGDRDQCAEQPDGSVVRQEPPDPRAADDHPEESGGEDQQSATAQREQRHGHDSDHCQHGTACEQSRPRSPRGAGPACPRHDVLHVASRGSGRSRRTSMRRRVPAARRPVAAGEPHLTLQRTPGPSHPSWRRPPLALAALASGVEPAAGGARAERAREIGAVEGSATPRCRRGRRAGLTGSARWGGSVPPR